MTPATETARTVAVLPRARARAGVDALSSALSEYAHVVAARDGVHPDAYLAAADDLGELDARFGAVPIAVVTEPGEDVPARAAVAVMLPRPAIDARAHPPVSPAVRARFRRLLGIPDELVVVIGFETATPLSDLAVPSALALAHAAAVRGPHLLLALALGTPTVTDRESARAIGAVDDRDVAVADAGDELRTARELGDDVRRAARLGWGARTLVERAFDAAPAARDIALRTGLSDDAATATNVAARLRELGTPDGSPVATRALEACEPFLALAATARSGR